nr:hypothetical protein GCM10020093_085600 [Planobispora longispora]
MNMTCDEARISLGVYVLGALDPEERAPVEAHLEGCADCRAELAELGGVAGFLGRVSEDDIAQAASPPRAVLDRLLNARARRRKLARVMLSLAASAVVIGLGGAYWATTAGIGDDAVTTAQSAPEAATDSRAAAPFSEDAGSGAGSAEAKAAPSRSPQDAARDSRLAPEGTPTPDVVMGDQGDTLAAKGAKGGSAPR